MITFSTLSARCLNPRAVPIFSSRPPIPRLSFSFSLSPFLHFSHSLARNCSCSHQQTAARAKKLAKKLRGENRRRRARRDNGPRPGRFLLILGGNSIEYGSAHRRRSPACGFSRKPCSFSPSSNFLSLARYSTEARKHFVADRRAGLIRLHRENFRIRGRVGQRRL